MEADKICGRQAGGSGEPVKSFQSNSMPESQESQWCASSLKDIKKPMSQLQSCQAGRIPAYSGRSQPFVLLRTVPDWMRITYMRESNLLYSINLNIRLIQKHPPRNTQNNVWQNIWAPCGPVKLIHKINHHIGAKFDPHACGNTLRRGSPNCQRSWFIHQFNKRGGVV